MELMLERCRDITHFWPTQVKDYHHVTLLALLILCEINVREGGKRGGKRTISGKEWQRRLFHLNMVLQNQMIVMKRTPFITEEEWTKHRVAGLACTGIPTCSCASLLMHLWRMLSLMGLGNITSAGNVLKSQLYQIDLRIQIAPVNLLKSWY